MLTLLRASTTPAIAVAFVPLLALAALVGPASRVSILLLILLLAMLTAVLSFLRAFQARGPLVRGLVAQGEVLTAEAGPRGGLRGLLRVDDLVRQFEADYTWGLSARLRPGDHIEALIDPDQDKVLWCLGLAAHSA